ncbi:MAG: Fe-S cluster assembly protein SufB [Chloroflexi bacterium]|nr:MAG: Fe-S cluster assembly protein SufB [Chloroflexota bacterium]
MATAPKQIEVGSDYKEKYGFFVPEDYIFKAKRGLNAEIVKEISWMKKEPEWMLNMRLRSLEIFRKKPMPKWGADLSVIDFENIFYYLKASDRQSKTWEDLPPDIKATYDRLGVPEAERKFLAGVSAQYESEVVYHSLQEELTKKGVIFTDTDSALRDYPELFKEYFGTVIPPADNKFSALNTAVWSGGSFIYVPKGVRVEVPLQAYFRINAENMGQFERTLIICDEGSFVHYIEGCTAPIYTTDSLHSAVVEIIVKKNARCRYTTIQNWSTNVFNLVTKRAMAYQDATMEWVDGNLGCLAAGTLVDTEAGPKPIESIAVGDHVWSRDSSGEMILQAPIDGQHMLSGVATMVRPRTAIGSVKAVVPADEQATYDIEVDDTANFIANGIVAHNSQITMKYPSVYLMEPGAKGDVLSVAFAGKGQHQDAGGKMIHVAPNTTSTITSKSISKGGGRTSYRGHIKIYPGANNCKSFVKCDALLLDDESRSDTYPYNDVDAENVTLGHEATVSKVSDEQLFYLMSRGIPRAEAETMIVNGFIEPFTKELPLEYAVELNRLIQLEMEGSVG